MKTLGIKPALPVAVITAVITYLLTQSVLELPPGIVVACQALVIALGVAAAGPGKVVAASKHTGQAFHGERGQASWDRLAYMLAGLIVFIILIVILFKVIDRL